jgi:hypothetical protein
MISDSPILLLTALSWLWSWLTPSLLLNVAVKVLSCGRGGQFRLRAEEVAELNAWHFGYARNLVAGPVLGRGWVGWSDTLGSTVAWSLGPRPRVEVATSTLPMWMTPKYGVRRYVGEGLNHRHYFKPPIEKLPTPHAWQRDAVAAVRACAHSCVVLATGPPGCGKSMLAELIADAHTDMGHVVVFDLNPIRPGTENAHWGMYNSARNNNEDVMVIVIDEADTILDAVMNGPRMELAVAGKGAQCPQGGGKAVWNTFMDDLVRSSRPKVITLLTANRSRAAIVSEVLRGDDAPLRESRVTFTVDVGPEARCKAE